MIIAEIISEGEEDALASTAFQQAPAVGDRIWLKMLPGRTVEVVRREWTAVVNGRSPSDQVTLWVRDVEERGEPA